MGGQIKSWRMMNNDKFSGQDLFSPRVTEITKIILKRMV